MNFGIEDIKRWQWAVIGLLGGLLIAYVQLAAGGGDYARTFGASDFMRLRQPPLQDTYPWMDRVVVYPNGDGHVVRAQLLYPTKKSKEWVYKTHWLTDWRGAAAVNWRGRRNARAKRDPADTVLKFLAEAAKQDPKVKFTYAWWWEPRWMLSLSALGGLVLVGGVWPTVLNLMIGAGLGRPKRAEPAYDLSRFKGEPAAPEAAPAAGSSEELDDRLRQMEEELLANLKSDVAGRYEEAPAEPTQAKMLGAGAAEIAPVPAAGGDDKQFKGEYYPVARKVEKHDEHPHPS